MATPDAPRSILASSLRRDDPSEAAYYERLRARVAALPPDSEFDARFAAWMAKRETQARRWTLTEMAAEADEEAMRISTVLMRRKRSA